MSPSRLGRVLKLELFKDTGPILGTTISPKFCQTPMSDTSARLTKVTSYKTRYVTSFKSV